MLIYNSLGLSLHYLLYQKKPEKTYIYQKYVRNNHEQSFSGLEWYFVKIFLSVYKSTGIISMTMCFNYTKKRLTAVARRSLLGEIWKSRNGGKVFGEDRYKC